MPISDVTVGLLFGGSSAEHEVSILSAKNVFEALTVAGYKTVLIFADKLGKWYLCECGLNNAFPAGPSACGPAVGLLPGGQGRVVSADREESASLPDIDVLFPVLHGPFGEDGTVQGLAEIARVPYVGPGVCSSAIAMDKDVAKRLLRDAGIPVSRFVTLKRSDPPLSYHEATQKLGEPIFVKPARLGSSVGINKVESVDEYENALAAAFKYDNKILIEECIRGREIECGVLEFPDGRVVASVAGEIKPSTRHAFYTYDAKYIDSDGAGIVVPADLPAAVADLVQIRAQQVFHVMECEGMARIDFFLTAEHELLVNEVNTIPGFTNISMYPKVFAAAGIASAELVSTLVEQALVRHKEK
jgi:D-alanine-D-alanine ligase